MYIIFNYLLNKVFLKKKSKKKSIMFLTCKLPSKSKHNLEFNIINLKFYIHRCCTINTPNKSKTIAIKTTKTQL